MPNPTEIPDTDRSAPASTDDLAHCDELQDTEGTLTSHEAVPPKSRLAKWLKRLVVTALLLLLVVTGIVLLLLTLARVEPEFYTTALKVDLQEQKRHGSQMETGLLDLRNSIIVSEEWSAEFTEKQLNGWLAWDLQKKFPSLLPPQISDPRIDIDDEQKMTLAFRCDAKPFEGVGVIKAEIFLTGVINQIGIRIKSLRSGMVPIPFSLFAEQISQYAEKAELQIEWANHEGDPVIILDIPETLLKHSGNYIEFKSLEIGGEKVQISGVTHLENY